MSLDDECPTQYFGADAVMWTHPNGKTYSLSPGQVEAVRLTEKLLDGHTDLHAKGCAEKRTGRCTCDYLALWPQAHIPNPSMSSEDAESLFKEPGTLIPHLEPRFIKGAQPMQLPVVIASGDISPAELAERIIKQNPDLFGHVDTKDLYRSTEDTITVDAKKYKEDTQAWGGLVDQRNMWESRAKEWKAATICTALFAVVPTVLAVGQGLGWF